MLPSLWEEGAGSRDHEDQAVKEEQKHLSPRRQTLENVRSFVVYLQHSHHHHLDRTVEKRDSLWKQQELEGRGTLSHHGLT